MYRYICEYTYKCTIYLRILWLWWSKSYKKVESFAYTFSFSPLKWVSTKLKPSLRCQCLMEIILVRHCNHVRTLVAFIIQWELCDCFFPLGVFVVLFLLCLAFSCFFLFCLLRKRGFVLSLNSCLSVSFLVVTFSGVSMKKTC